MADTNILMTIIFVDILIILALTNFVESRIMIFDDNFECQDLPEVMKLKEKTVDIKIDRDKDGNIVISKEVESGESGEVAKQSEEDREVMCSAMSPFFTIFNTFGFDVPAGILRWVCGGQEKAESIAEWVYSSAIDLTMDITQTVKTVARPFGDFISIVNIMIYYPNCTNIPSELVLLVFAPLVIGLIYITLKMLPFFGGG